MLQDERVVVAPARRGEQDGLVRQGVLVDQIEEMFELAGIGTAEDRCRRDQEVGLLSEPDFLLEAGPDGMRMSDLAQRRLMSTGGFTRLADRLQNRGLIERRRSAADGRGLDATLTADGRTLIRRARRQHHNDLRDLFFARLDDDHPGCLAEIWGLLGPATETDDGGGTRKSGKACR